MTDPTPSLNGLAALLEQRLVEWDKASEPQKAKLLECYQDVMRIARDDDTKNTGAARSKKASSLFIGSTRNKVRAARAKINDALFGNGLMPFDTTPTDEKLAPFSDVVEDIVTEQLERMDFRSLLKAGVDTLATYGTGFMFGPFVRPETLTETAGDDSAGTLEIKETEYTYDHPYFELASTLDVIPDAEARNLPDGLGVFWSTMESPHTVRAWGKDDSYQNIAQALLAPGANGNETGSEQAQERRANINLWHKAGRIKVARFFGRVPKSLIAENELQDADGEPVESGELVSVVAIMAGGVVVKVSESPYGNKLPAYRCAYEDVPHEMWGVGVAENNAPHQKVVNAAFRLYMDGKGMALLGTMSVDRSVFMPTENFLKHPGKVYEFKPGTPADKRKDALIMHTEPDITGGWMDVINASSQMSDDDTGITKYSQGDDSSNLNKTATGISMIMSASSLPIKEVIQNIDACWIEPIIECLINWNLKYLDPETVRKIHGEEAAATWAKIRKFGKSSFMNWQATGTSSFMQKEVLTNKLRAFADFAMSNPVTAPLIDARELLEQTWQCMEIGKESPILEKEGEAEIPPQVQQQMQQMQEQTQELESALKEVGDKFNELHADAEGKREERQLKAYDATTKRLQVLAPFLTPEMAMQLAYNVGLNVDNDPDLSQQDGDDGASEPEPQEPAEMDEAPAMAPPEQPQEPEPPPPEEMQPEQPADAGFFTPDEQSNPIPEA